MFSSQERRPGDLGPRSIHSQDGLGPRGGSQERDLHPDAAGWPLKEIRRLPRTAPDLSGGPAGPPRSGLQAVRSPSRSETRSPGVGVCSAPACGDHPSPPQPPPQPGPVRPGPARPGPLCRLTTLVSASRLACSSRDTAWTPDMSSLRTQFSPNKPSVGPRLRTSPRPRSRLEEKPRLRTQPRPGRWGLGGGGEAAPAQRGLADGGILWRGVRARCKGVG